jgi:hypothetical protein
MGTIPSSTKAAEAADKARRKLCAACGGRHATGAAGCPVKAPQPDPPPPANPCCVICGKQLPAPAQMLSPVIRIVYGNETPTFLCGSPCSTPPRRAIPHECLDGACKHLNGSPPSMKLMERYPANQDGVITAYSIYPEYN